VTDRNQQEGTEPVVKESPPSGTELTGGAILDLQRVPAPELRHLQVMQFQALPAMKG